MAEIASGRNVFIESHQTKTPQASDPGCLQFSHRVTNSISSTNAQRIVPMATVPGNDISGKQNRTDAIPEEMRSRPQWLTWKLDNGQKIPNGKSNDSTTWHHYDDISHFPKIAFVFSLEDPLCGIDLDGCIVDGEFAEWSLPIIEQFKGVAYCEVSPSGSGVKLTTKAKKPDGALCVHKVGEGKQQIECYDNRRFWAVTGQVVEGFETIGDGQSALDWLVATYLTKPGHSPKQKKGRKQQSAGSSSKLYARAQSYVSKVGCESVGNLRNGAFKLSGHIHSFVGPEGERLSNEEVYRLLQMWNAKNSTPLRDDEIQEAVENGRNNGSPPPDKEEDDRIDASRVDPQTEATNVLESHQHLGFNRLIFWGGGFLYWTKGKFVPIPNSEARTIIVKSLNERFTGVGTSVVSDVLEQVRAASLLSVQVQPPSWLTENEWRPEDVIATENAIVHLPSLSDGSMTYTTPSTPSFFTTSALDYDFDDSKPDCPNWKSFIKQLWPDDQDCIDTLQEWFGYCLTPDTRQQKILMMLGPKRSGKGTICRVLRSVVGDGNVCGPTLASLQTNFGLWPLLGKTVAIVSDARLSGRSDQAVITERLLSISGEDAQTIDRKNMEPVTTKLSTRFMIVSNELPRLQDSSGAFTGRMIVLRLSESFYGREDQQLSDRLMDEREGILHWAIDGWKRLRERSHFVQPESGMELVQQLNELASPILSFVEDRCEVDYCYTITVQDLYSGWCEWCKEVGREPSTTQTFGRDLSALLPRLRLRQIRLGAHRERKYEGIRLTESRF
jgi:P4 family phage/plasmid primase-like protien